jgi:hypothetical protein
MIFTVLLQGFAQLFFSAIFLIPLCFIFAVISIFSNGNAIDQPRIIFITGARYEMKVYLFKFNFLVVVDSVKD